MSATAVKPRGIPLAKFALPAAGALVRKDRRSIEEAFPNVDPGLLPAGERILVQLRTPLTEVDFGGGKRLILADETRETEMWNEQVALVRAVGPMAYRNRTTMEPWPEGAWCEVGQYVYVPKYHQNKTQVSTGPKSEDIALFVMLKDIEVIGVVTGDPRSIKAFI